MGKEGLKSLLVSRGWKTVGVGEVEDGLIGTGVKIVKSQGLGGIFPAPFLVNQDRLFLLEQDALGNDHFLDVFAGGDLEH